MHCALTFLALGLIQFSAPAQPAAVFPGATWEAREPAAVGVDAAKLHEAAQVLGGRGCIIKDGYLIHFWGSQTERTDWMSAAKPVLSTLLFFALQEGKVKSVDQPIAEFGWPMSEKDKGITFRHLGAMTSGYARPEGPGQAWAYNDFAIQLYQKTLFEKVFQQGAQAVSDDPNRLAALQFEDGLNWREDKPRLRASTRDFARIAWFWHNQGKWGERQLLPADYFKEFVQPQVGNDIPNTAEAETDDYLGIGTYGGGSAHFAQHGPGIYGFNWWFNRKGPSHPDKLLWPGVPEEVYAAIGAGGNFAVIFPAQNMLLISAQGEWDKHNAGEEDTRTVQVLKTLVAGASVTHVTPDEPASTTAEITGALKKWHRVTLSFKGPQTHEQGAPNPFFDYRLNVTFTQGDRSHVVPGYYAADGNAGETSAHTGHVWRAHFMPDAEGTWHYTASFRSDAKIAVRKDPALGKPVAFDGASGAFDVGPTDKALPDARAAGLLQYTGKRYLQFAETDAFFIKGGADSPENFLAFADFDATKPSHQYAPHAQDWREGDPVWQGGKGKNILGALNYLAGKGMNNVYFLTMNVKGDGEDVWPWTSEKERYRFDCSKLDQWEAVFDHMDRLGLLLHVVLQEQENDQLLDKGELGAQRKLYMRELIARFGHHPALIWNLGEENTNTTEQRRDFAQFLQDSDPYRHPVVLHTFPSQIDEVYDELLGFKPLHGPSVQLGNMELTHEVTKDLVEKSEAAGHPWFVCLDEIGPANVGVMPDADDPEHEDVRRYALWGNLMAGGSGAEWLFGYSYPHNDINCEDWRSRDRMWDLTRYAMEFFQRHLPFAEMQAHDDLILSGPAWCLAKPGEVYAVYWHEPGPVQLQLEAGTYSVSWYNPRTGGDLIPGAALAGAASVTLPAPPEVGVDWALLLQRVRE